MKLAQLLITSASLFTAAPALAGEDLAANDQAAIVYAYSAIGSKNFEDAISAVDPVIKRFEDGKQDDTVYRCASEQTDVLNTLLGAALLADNGAQDEGKSVTAAVSDNICSAYFIRGFALIDLGGRNEALPNLEIAVEMDPDNQHYMNELAEWYKTGRDWPRSLEIFTAASETTDMSIALMDDKDQSRQILNGILCRSYRGIAFNHAEMRNWKEARTAIDKCLKLIPDDARSKQELDYIVAQSVEK